MLTNAGSGFSTCQGLDVTRWREDPTRDAWGQFCYVRDLDAGHGLVGRLPAGRAGRPTTTRSSSPPTRPSSAGATATIETLLEVTVSPEQRAEVRRVTLTNHDARPRELELTSYAEVVLGPHGADLAHPAFGKLFLETEWVPAPRPCSAGAGRGRRRAAAVWAVHVMAVDARRRARGRATSSTRPTGARFLGRGRTPADPAALDPGAALSGTTGPVLDPVFSLRRRVRIEPGGSAVVAFTTAVAETREEALALADQYHELSAVARAFELAWAHSQVEQRPSRTGRPRSPPVPAAGLARPLRRPRPAGRPAVLAANRQGQPALWRHGISGDRPIVLVADRRRRTSCRWPASSLVAHAFLRLKGLEFDLVLLDEAAGELPRRAAPAAARSRRPASDARDLARQAGRRLRARRRRTCREDDAVLLQAAARVVLVGDRGPLAGQLDRIERVAALPPALARPASPGRWDDEPGRPARPTCRSPTASAASRPTAASTA